VNDLGAMRDRLYFYNYINLILPYRIPDFHNVSFLCSQYSVRCFNSLKAVLRLGHLNNITLAEPTKPENTKAKFANLYNSRFYQTDYFRDNNLILQHINIRTL
jgi:hypothetical protein